MYDHTVVSRFWAKVNIGNPDECWEWKGAKRSSGHGTFYIGGGRKNTQRIIASRMAWELTNGPIPDGMNACHKCDNGACVNPDHIFIGTQKDNIQDMIKKGRRVQKNVHGEDAPQHKLTNNNVKEIRMLYATGEYSQEELGRMFGVNQTMIGFIVRRVKWKHIP